MLDAFLFGTEKYVKNCYNEGKCTRGDSMTHHEFKAFVVQKILREQASKAEVVMELKEEGHDYTYRHIERVLESEGIVFYEATSRWIQCAPYYSVESIIEDSEALAAERGMTLEQYIDQLLERRKYG